MTIALPARTSQACRFADDRHQRLRAKPIGLARQGSLWAWICVGLCLWLALPAWAAMGDSEPGEPAWVTDVRKELKAQRFDQAVSALKTANAVESAEWHNLLGYALRKRSPPDLVAAEAHYKRALEIDPKHRHAMEYYGELFLMKGDLPAAEAMLKRLDRACFFGCEELRDLKKAVERYKATRK